MQVMHRLKDLVRLSRAGDISDDLRGRLFGYIFWVILLLALVGIVVTGGLFQASPAARLGQGLVLLFLGLVWILWRRGHITAATTLIVWSFWGLTLLVVLGESNHNSMWMVPQFLLVVLTRFLLSGWVAVFMALLTAILDFLIFSLALRQRLFPGLQLMAYEGELPPLIMSVLFLVFIFFLGDTVLRESLLEARRNEGRYRSLFEHTNDAVFLIDPQMRYLDVNQQGAALLGYERQELLGKPIAEVIAPTEVAAMKANFTRLEREGNVPLFERTMIRKDASRIITEVSLSLVKDEDGMPLYHQSIVRDITERKRLEDQLRFSLEEMQTLAMQDPLTGLLNRRAVTEHAEAEWFRAQREGRPMCLVLVDLDNLKVINDVQGHTSGDKVILELARAIKMQKRRYDWAGRWGGDEFLLVLPGATLSEAGDVAERVRNQYTQSPLVHDAGQDASVSLGVSCYSGRRGDSADFNHLLNQADEALYKAKQSGKNQVQLYRD